MRRLVPLLLVTTALVGCVGSEDPGEPDAPAHVWAERALPFGEGHDHLDRAQHAGLSTSNFDVVGYDPLITDYHGGTSGSYFCGDVATGGERHIGVVISFDSEMTIVLVDLTDPAAPEKLGELALPNTNEYDAAITPDGRYVLVAASRPATPSAPTAGPALQTARTEPVAPTFIDRCGQSFTGPEEELPLGPSVLLVDVQDPTNPTIVDVLPQPVFGVHSIFATEIDGEVLALASVTNLVHHASYFTLMTITERPDGAALEVVGAYDAESPTTTDRPHRILEPDPSAVDPERSALSNAFSQFDTNGHVDGWIAKHPGTGETLVYLAAWDAGLHILRYEGPGQLTPLATWNDYDPAKGSAMTGQIHGAYPLWEMRDGKHYTVIGQEVSSRPADRPTGQVIVLDTTDPSAPKAVSRWTLPVDVSWDAPGNLQFSTHYTTIIDDTLFVALYHGGVWAVDISDPEVGELPTIGVFLPDHASPKPPGEGVRVPAWAPTVLDTVPLPTGELVVYDAPSGVYTVSFDADSPMPAPEPWTEDSWL